MNTQCAHGHEMTPENTYWSGRPFCRTCSTARKLAYKEAKRRKTEPDLPGEEWRVVPGTDGLYEVSNMARVRRILTRGQRRPVLRTWLNSSGYLRLALQIRGRFWQRPLHHVVAEAFVGLRPSPDHQVNHIDGNKLNNTPGNLEWVTSQENIAHAARNGLYATGERWKRARHRDTSHS